ncbi:MAG: hypothetical protein JWO99_293 [Candidatus Saccharibacteria bacterium]|nr:hypothetical protein [Candidatus Saccharibacteria bacterium]
MEQLPYVIIIAIVALAVITLAIVLPVRSFRKHGKITKDAMKERTRIHHAQEAIDSQVTQWIRPILRAAMTPEDDLKVVGYGPPPAHYEQAANRLGVQDALERQSAAQARIDALAVHYAAADALFAELRTQSDDVQGLYDTIQQALDDHASYITQEDLDWAEDRLDDLIGQRCTTLLEEARQGNKESFDELLELDHDGCWLTDDEEHPSDWEDLVAKFIPNPKVKDFGRRTDPKPGELRLLADKAIRYGLYTEAKVVLAYCNRRKQPEFYDEVGMSFATQLARLIGSKDQAKSTQITTSSVAG